MTVPEFIMTVPEFIMTVPEFIEGVERDVDRWQREGLSAPAALNQAWANALLDLESEGVLPRGYLRVRHQDDDGRRDGLA